MKVYNWTRVLYMPKYDEQILLHFFSLKFSTLLTLSIYHMPRIQVPVGCPTGHQDGIPLHVFGQNHPAIIPISQSACWETSFCPKVLEWDEMMAHPVL